MPCQRDFINAVEFFQMRADFRCLNRKGGEPAVAGNFAGDPLGNFAFRFRFLNQRKIRMRMGVDKSGGENQPVGIDGLRKGNETRLSAASAVHGIGAA